MGKGKLTAYDNLLAQLDSIRKHNNELSYETRGRYYDSTCRFLRYYADEWHGQKFANVSVENVIFPSGNAIKYLGEYFTLLLQRRNALTENLNMLTLSLLFQITKKS